MMNEEIVFQIIIIVNGSFVKSQNKNENTFKVIIKKPQKIVYKQIDECTSLAIPIIFRRIEQSIYLLFNRGPV